MISILDLKPQYQSLQSQMEKAVLDVLRSGRYINGPNCQKFQKDAATYLGCKQVVGVANGTEALYLALRSLDIGPGDEVITVAMTFIATMEAICNTGAKPVFVDIDPNTYNMDVTQIESKITDKTKAILPVHLYGQPVEMDKVLEIARKYNLKIVEDCAQAIGAEYKGQKVGTFGDCGCFSFFPSKNLGAYGDGGMVATNSEEIAKRLQGLKDHGSLVKYYHDELGVNSRLDEIQAAVLNVKLPHLDQWNDSRRQVAYRYNNLFKGFSSVVTPQEINNVKSVYHQYTIKVNDRDLFQSALKDAEIVTMIYYPLALHKQKAYIDLYGDSVQLPHTEEACKHVISLPIYPELTEELQDQVVDAVKKALNLSLSC